MLIQSRIPTIAAVLMPLTLAVVAGCGGQRRAAPVNPEQARQTLRGVLDNWKAGQTPALQRQAHPSIIVQDMDWQGGCALVDYQFIGDGRSRGANLHIPVELTLRERSGAERKKKAFYVVGTDPALTVFRELPL
jgi:hypothetical protein